MRRSTRLTAWIVFLTLAALFSGVIGYGIATTNLHGGKLSKIFVGHRIIVPDRTAAGVSVELRVEDLRKQPALRVRAAGLASGEPLRLYLTDSNEGAAPRPLEKTVNVDEKGRTSDRVPLPEQGLRHYRSVTGVQGKRVVFRAPLT